MSINRVRLAALSALALLASLLVAVGLPASDAAVARTTITIRVTGCNGCTLGPFNFRTQRSFAEKKVRNGKVVFSVPTNATKGLGFFMGNSAPNPQYVAEFFAVARYAGKKPGQPVTNRYAVRATKATQCWAGTSRRNVSLKLTVVHHKGEGNSGETVDEIRSFFSPSLRSIGTPWRTYRGELGSQSVINCSGQYPG